MSAATVPTATDLAATLRRFAEQFDSHDGWTIDEDMDIYSWLLESPDGSIKARCYARVTAERIAWLFNNDIELMAALERGAAAEAVVAAVKLFNDHDEDDDTPYEATHLALAAYDALTEGKPT